MTGPVIHLDFETRSAVDLKTAGTYRYAEDPSTTILCASYRVDDGAIERWRPQHADERWVADVVLLETFREALASSVPIRAHNAGFERAIWNWVMARHREPYDTPRLTPEQMDCTLARANALNLPASLEGVGAALRSPVQKDKEGHALMLRMCKADYHPKPGEQERLEAYCDQDVATECAIDNILPPLSPSERRLWILDQHINDRGFYVDRVKIARALAAAQEAQRLADRRMFDLTGGAVGRCTQTKRIVAWLNERGIPCESVKEADHDELIVKCDLFGDPVAIEVIDLRESASKTFKFQSMLDTCCRDGRIRGTLVYQGAISGRWTGRKPQPHNMKRIMEEDEQKVSDALWVLDQPMSPAGHATALEVLCGDVLNTLSLCARPMIVAPSGKKLVGGDFSNIEGRLNAWINGEDWKVQAFREEQPIYEMTAAGILDKDIKDVTKSDRQLWGKVPELACGYQGGVNAFHKMGANYGVRVTDSVARRAVSGWRDQNPLIVEGWYDLQNAAIEAVNAPGLLVPALGGNIHYKCADGFLWCRLPSERVIAYPGAIVERKQKTVIIDGDEVTFDNWGVSFWGEKKGWRKLDLYGGMQMAHVVSGSARDILASAMHRLDPIYPIVLTVHDETLSEVDEDFGSAAEYQKIMEVREPWFRDLPLTAKAWEGPVYAH